MNRVWLLILATIMPGTAWAQTPLPEECKLHRIASFPITWVGDRITIPVSVNGTEEHFLVDTGGYVTSISQDAAASLKLEPHNIMMNRIEDAGGKEATQYVWADSFKLGSMEAKKFDLMVDLVRDPRIDGTLAPDLLRNFDLDFDFATMTLNLFRPHACEGQAVYWTKDYIALPMDILKSGHARVDVTLDNENMDAILDTGASVTVMTLNSARHYFDLDKDSSEVSKLGHITGGLGSVNDTYRYAFKSLSMGGVAATNPKIVLADAPTVMAAEHASLVLGMSELRYLHLYFAYHERKLYISTVQAQ
jgi:predicted aspartyl protease